MLSRVFGVLWWFFVYTGLSWDLCGSVYSFSIDLHASAIHQGVGVVRGWQVSYGMAEGCSPISICLLCLRYYVGFWFGSCPVCGLHVGFLGRMGWFSLGGVGFSSSFIAVWVSRLSAVHCAGLGLSACVVDSLYQVAVVFGDVLFSLWAVIGPFLLVANMGVWAGW